MDVPVPDRAPDGRRVLEVRSLGRVSYEDGLSLQADLVEQRRTGLIPDQLLLLEHPHVITLGVKTRHDRSHVLASDELLVRRGVAVHESGRGGDVTYHGPGQLVGYPILDLKPDRCDVHRYVRDVEEALIRVAAAFGISGVRVPGHTGVWVGRDKLAAIGIRISRWITSHGFALNVSTDLSFFDLIVPCGIRDRGVTSLERLAGRPVGLDEVGPVVAEAFGAVFGRQVVECPPATGRSGHQSILLTH